jgi:hypothetical protein
MTGCATRRVPDDYQTVLKNSEADDSCLSVVLPLVFDLGSQSIEDRSSIVKVKSAMDQCPVALWWIVGDAHRISVYTYMPFGKRNVEPGCL